MSAPWGRFGGARATLALAALLAAAVWAVPARGQDGTPAATPEGTPGPSDCTADLGIVRSAKTCVAVVHASPDAPPVDVYLDGQLAVAGLAFGTAASFQNVPAGTHRVQIAAAGTDVSTAVIDRTVELVAARAYEIAALGPLASITAELYDVDVHAIPGDAYAGMARVRVVHASPDAPPLEVALIGGDIAQRLDAGLTFPAASAYRELSAGTYRLRLAPTDGTDAALDASVSFARDAVTSVYVVGRVVDDSLRLVPVAARASRLPALATPAATPPS